MSGTIEEDASEEITVDLPSPSLPWLQAQECTDVVVDCYSSIASPEMDELLVTLANGFARDVSFFQATARERFRVTNASIDSYFDLTGVEQYRAARTVSTVEGRMLIVLAPVRNDDVEAAIREARCGASLLRLLFGDLLVRQHKQRVRLREIDGKWLPERYSEPIGSAAGTLLNDFMDKENIHNIDFPLAVENAALELLDLASSGRDAHVRFMLLWTALEYQVRRFPGKNNGLRRQYWCDRVIRSTKVTDELERLRSVRNKTFKEGLLEADSFDELSLRCLLRLSAIQDKNSRATFILAYEQLLSQRDLGQVPRNAGFLRYTKRNNA